MDEMAKTLARRRAQAEKKEVRFELHTYIINELFQLTLTLLSMQPDPEPEVKQRPWEKSNTLPHKLSSGGGSSSSTTSTTSNAQCGANGNNTSNSGGESPRPMRKRFGSASEETILKVSSNLFTFYLLLRNLRFNPIPALLSRSMAMVCRWHCPTAIWTP